MTINRIAVSLSPILVTSYTNAYKKKTTLPPSTSLKLQDLCVHAWLTAQECDHHFFSQKDQKQVCNIFCGSEGTFLKFEKKTKTLMMSSGFLGDLAWDVKYLTKNLHYKLEAWVWKMRERAGKVYWKILSSWIMTEESCLWLIQVLLSMYSCWRVPANTALVY